MDLMEQALRAEIELLKDSNLEEQMQRARTLVEVFEENPVQKGTRAEARARMRLRLCEEAMQERGMTPLTYRRPDWDKPKPLATLGDLLKLHLNKRGSDDQRRGSMEGGNRPR